MALEINPNRSSGEGFNLNDKIIREQQLAGKNKSSHNPPIHEEEKSFEGKNINLHDIAASLQQQHLRKQQEQSKQLHY